MLESAVLWRDEVGDGGIVLELKRGVKRACAWVCVCVCVHGCVCVGGGGEIGRAHV